MDEGGVIQASVSVYPLLQRDFTGVHRAVAALTRVAGLDVRTDSLATTVVGPSQAVFAALEAAFIAARTAGPTVMTVTLSDACPVANGDGEDGGNGERPDEGSGRPRSSVRDRRRSPRPDR